MNSITQLRRARRIYTVPCEVEAHDWVVAFCLQRYGSKAIVDGVAEVEEIFTARVRVPDFRAGWQRRPTYRYFHCHERRGFEMLHVLTFEEWLELAEDGYDLPYPDGIENAIDAHDDRILRNDREWRRHLRWQRVKAKLPPDDGN